MNYPPSIYRKLEIVEKDIYGEIHYAVVETKKFLFFWEKKYYLHLSESWGHVWESQHKPFGDIWLNNKRDCEKGISTINGNSEYEFKRKVTNE